MGWKEWPYWLKGVIIGLIVGIIIMIYFAFPCMSLFSCKIIPGTDNSCLNPLSCIARAIIISIIPFTIFGLLVGWIIGKLKRK
jgi:hypothetical protein